MPAGDALTALCRCFTPPFVHRNYEARALGVDETGGRFAEVTREICRSCGQVWLRYFWEEEAQSRSGRWFRGAVTPEVAAAVEVSDALSVIEALPFHFRGGSYFDSTGQRIDHAPDPAREALLRLLGELRALVALPDNDFTWSSWQGVEHALGELDSIVAAIRRGTPGGFAGVSLLLLPTGPCQELALSSGWGDAFVDLANRVDAAVADMQKS